MGLASARRDGEGRSNALGNGGDVTIETNVLELLNTAAITSETFGIGDAGSITIKAQSINIDGRDALVSSRARGILERDIAIRWSILSRVVGVVGVVRFLLAIGVRLVVVSIL